MIILAHRGLWRTREDGNTPDALAAAFAAGFGVETDVRDHRGELVISHDPPANGSPQTFDEALRAYAAAGQPGRFAVNIKSDGLQAMVRDALQAAGVDKAFVFDMSVPDGLRYLREGLATFTRQSEYEPEPPYYGEAAGVWVDCFISDWVSPDVIRGHVAAGKAVALVSPELHGRPHERVWENWSEVADLPGVMLCTDFPDAARERLG